MTAIRNYQVQCYKAFPTVGKDEDGNDIRRSIVLRKLVVGPRVFTCTKRKGNVTFSDSGDWIYPPGEKWPQLYLDSRTVPHPKVKKGRSYTYGEILPEITRLIGDVKVARRAMSEVVVSEPS